MISYIYAFVAKYFTKKNATPMRNKQKRRMSEPNLPNKRIKKN